MNITNTKESLELKSSDFERVQRYQIKGLENILRVADGYISYLSN